MFKIIDLICSFIWSLFLLLNSCIYGLFYGIIFLFVNLWELLCYLGAVGRFLKRAEKIFKLAWKCSVGLLLKSIAAVYKTILEHIRVSKIGKRIFALIVLVLIAYCCFPPSHWGPWQKYQEGEASWYGPNFYWKHKADGTRYYPWDVSAAHKTLPLGTIVKVKNLDNGKVIYLKIDDRGPYKKNRILDFSYLAAVKLGMKNKGIARVEIYTKKK